MGKKLKSKQRLDTYYHYAKAQGYRSRAAYKLIQLNRKYNFLNNASVLIDLCAAPGGWMQVATEFMPLSSTIVGVDLDPIKRVAGAKSFQSDITTSQCYEQLRRQINDKKCDVVLNDGAPNVGANWSKDAYTQSQLVLAALKLACSFLKEGGYFVTKVFRSTDFQSLMWVFKKFFHKVEATKPKASRFSSAEIFVVCIGYLAPSFIDQKLFDATFIFKDTEADHFRQQLAGQITSIDKLLQVRRNRGGYEDNAPMHLYKQTNLTNLIITDNPLLVFAEYNKIVVSVEEKEKYFGVIKKQPSDLLEMFEDLKVLGKREVGLLLKWRGKLRQLMHKNEGIKLKQQRKDSIIVEEKMSDSEEQLDRQVLAHKKKQLRSLRQKEDKNNQLMIKSQMANQQHQQNDQQFEQDLEGVFESDMDELEYEQATPEEQSKPKGSQFADYNEEQLQKNLEVMYETRRAIIEQKKRIVREAKQERKGLKQQRYLNKEQKLKSRNFRLRDYNQYARNDEETVPQVIEGSTIEAENTEVVFQNPLANFHDEDIYLSENEEQYNEVEIDPNEKMEGELSDDDAYTIPKPTSDMQKRRKQLKKNELKKEKKLKKSVQEGQDVGGQIEIVKNKPIMMQDYNIDELATTLAIAKKMLKNRSRQDIIDGSYGRYSFEDHDKLPKWFTEDEKKYNFKSEPITKEEFQQQKDRLAAINARVPKKILQAKVRRKMRIQKKLKKTQKQAQKVMSQQGITEVNKLRQVSKMYDKSKRQLKDNKKYIVSKKNKTAGGKDSRNVKHVDNRMKKDKRSMKIKKTRQVHRKHKRRGKF